MKTKIISIVVMLMMACNVMGEDFVSVYKNDGSIITIPARTIGKLKASKTDTEGITHQVYKSQQFEIGDSVYSLSLEEIDSIVFLSKEVTHYPRTKEEFEESYNITTSVGNRSDEIRDSLISIGQYNASQLV